MKTTLPVVPSLLMVIPTSSYYYFTGIIFIDMNTLKFKIIQDGSKMQVYKRGDSSNLLTEGTMAVNTTYCLKHPTDTGRDEVVYNFEIYSDKKQIYGGDYDAGTGLTLLYFA